MAALALSAESLFQRYFLPLYPPDARADLAKCRAEDANPAQNPRFVQQLEEAAQVFVAGARRAFPNDLALDFSDASVHRLSHALTQTLRDQWAAKGPEGTPDNELFNIVLHGAAYVGSCIVRHHGGRWGIRRPLWESVVTLESAAGTGDLAVFHWWLKSLADDVLDQAPGTLTLADRYRTHVETPCADAPQRPILIPADRPLPRITKVRYDVFYKYIKAHLPELRDLGRDFPSPERFDELAFKWLQPMLVGQGRMILIAGLAKQGLHLFWLGDQGFEKSVYVPTDSFPEPIVKADDQKVYVIASMAGTLQTHEMLWWGP